MSMAGFYNRRHKNPVKNYWFTLNYETGYRATAEKYICDQEYLERRADELSLQKKRAVHVRKCWSEGNDVHFKTVSIHVNGRKLH